MQWLSESSVILSVLVVLVLAGGGLSFLYVLRRLRHTRFDAMVTLARQFPDPVLLTDHTGSVIAFSPAACDLLRYTEREMREKSIEDLMPAQYTQRHRKLRERFMAGNPGKAMDNEVICLNSKGEAIPSVTRVRTFAVGRHTYGMVSIRDLRPFKDREMLLKNLSEHDPLTGLANRRLFAHDYQREWQRAIRTGEQLAVLMVDVDAFKQYNDRYGHLAGDECLKTIASTLLHTVQRSTDAVARYGGEEFICVLPGVSLDEASAVAEHFRAAVEACRIPHQHSSVARWVTVSVGLAALAPGLHDNPDDLIRRADAALYRAKAEGRNRIAVDADLTAAVEREL